ncbi:sensor histidine kinase, partial [Chloroflexota bacterium]
DTYEDIRESIDQLSTEIKNLPIIPTMANYIQDFGNNNGIKVQFEYSKPFPQISPIAELQLFRITQEALTNVRRHADATEVEVMLEGNKNVIEMVIKDNGQGFALNDLEESPPGYHGLNIVKERAEALGGEVNISTAPGEGTAVMVTLPVEKVRL